MASSKPCHIACELPASVLKRATTAASLSLSLSLSLFAFEELCRYLPVFGMKSGAQNKTVSCRNQIARQCIRQWRSKALRGPGSTVTWGRSLSLPSTPLSLLFPTAAPPQPSPSPCREAAPQIKLEGLGERCKLPQRGLGQSPSQNRIWCIFALKSVIWWQQF